MLLQWARPVSCPRNIFNNKEEGTGVSFQALHHLNGGSGTAPIYCILKGSPTEVGDLEKDRITVAFLTYLFCLVRDQLCRRRADENDEE